MPPIKASEINNAIPEIVFDCFNELIKKNFANGYATIHQEDVLNLIGAKGIVREVVFSSGYLNIESDYEKAGWRVEYVKPDYNDFGKPYFRFTKKGTKRKWL